MKEGLWPSVVAAPVSSAPDHGSSPFLATPPGLGSSPDRGSSLSDQFHLGPSPHLAPPSDLGSSPLLAPPPDCGPSPFPVTPLALSPPPDRPSLRPPGPLRSRRTPGTTHRYCWWGTSATWRTSGWCRRNVAGSWLTTSVSALQGWRPTHWKRDLSRAGVTIDRKRESPAGDGLTRSAK
jgi:hypothetical protein